ncbi:MAG: DUF2461 domain-containing protein [Pseudonocardiales bacterium]|nr:DUF2461 domain-containing protein [Pseudonocardiales bacterium]
MRFDGFGEHAVDFYEGMAADNSKAYWSDHKAVYDDQIHAPMLALLDELQPEFGTGKIFRPYRDVRFSSDKSPYKTHCGAVIQVTGVAFYTQLGADGLIVAGGAYHWSADQLARYRMAVDAERSGEDLRRLLAAVPGGSAGMQRGGDLLRSRPRGSAADHPRLDLLRHRSLYLWRSWPPDEVLHQRACLDRVRDGWRITRPLTAWLARHVGATET